MRATIFTSTIYRVMVIILCYVVALDLRAQSFEEQNAKMMTRMDTESFKEKIVLNKAIALDHQLEPFRQREKDKDGAYRIHLYSIFARNYTTAHYLSF